MTWHPRANRSAWPASGRCHHRCARPMDQAQLRLLHRRAGSARHGSGHGWL